MNIKNYFFSASLMLAAVSLATSGLAKAIEDPGFKISADKLEQLTDSHLRASGAVTLNIDGTEIKSDAMDVFTSTHEIRLVSGKFKAVIQK